MVDNLYILGDRPSFSDAQSKSAQFTTDDTWVNQDRYPRQVADINGDGRADIVGFAQDGVYVALADGAGGFSAAQVGLPTQFSTDDTWVSQNRYPRQVADINGDGRADIVGFAQDGVYVALSNGNGTFANATLGLATQFSTDNTWVSQDRYPRQVADVNGDGRADIVGFGQDAVYVALANSDGTFANATIGLSNGFTADDGGWASQNQYPRQLADVNGDGRADIVGFGQNAVYVSLANSDGTFSDAIAGLTTSFTGDTTWVSQDRYPRQVADVNGDGRADLIGFAQDSVYVSLSNGDGTFADATVGFANGFTPNGGGWASQNQYPRQVADIDGDGQADLIGFGQNGVYVARSTTQKNDVLNGGDGDDTLHGLTGNDILRGGLGNDSLYGGEDNDQLVGGDGNDQLYGENGIDILVGDAGDDFLYGGEGYDQLYGGAGNDKLDGGEGNDFIDGGDGNDQLFGVDGNDQLFGNNGSDTLSGVAGDDFLYGGDDNDQLYGGAGNDYLSGDSGDDLLLGSTGNDRLVGGGGNDYLNGTSITGTEKEKDVLIGGAGSDRFVLGERIVEQNNLGQAFYTKGGKYDYALITDWDPKSARSDKTFDRVQLAGNSRQYKLNFAKLSGIGGAAKDTEILFKVGKDWERIGIIEDSTKFNLKRDAVFI